MQDNPRAVIGDNRAPDYAERVAQELRDQYAETIGRVQELLDQIDELPDVVDDETMGVVAKLVKAMKDEHKRLDAIREAEKAPYFRASQAVDGVFFALMEKLVRKTRTSKPGAADILQAEVDAYNQAKLAAEKERRRQEAEAAAREEQKRREAEAKARQEAEEKRLAAERARSQSEAKGAIADKAESAAAAAQASADQAAAAAEDARIATLAKPADIVRHRVEEGPLVTMGTEPYAVIEDYTVLDMVTLWPFVSMDAKDKALRAWAKVTNYSQQTPGARVGKRPKTVLR